MAMSFDPEREKSFTRAACAEWLIDAGAIVMPSVCESLIQSRARGLLQLFRRKDLLPRTLKFFSALGDLDAVRAHLDGNDQATVNEAFLIACSFHYEDVASLLLERAIALDPELGTRIDATTDRGSFITFFIDRKSMDWANPTKTEPWKAFAMGRVTRAIHDDDLAAFVSVLRREPWLLGDEYVPFQNELIEKATLNDRGPFIAALFDLDPGDPAPPAAAAIASHRDRMHLREAPPHSAPHPHLAISRRPAARGRDRRSLAGEGLVRRIRRAGARRRREPLPIQSVHAEGAS